MHNMFGQCTGSSLRVGEKHEAMFGCTYEDKDGDNLFETGKATAPRTGQLIFVGGTGKFDGLQCDGNFKTVAVSKDRSKGVGKKTGSCRTQ